MQNSNQDEQSGKWTMATAGWPVERWLAVVVLGALALLIAIRMGFRGVNVLGASATIG